MTDRECFINNCETGDIVLFHHKNECKNLYEWIYSMFTNAIMFFTKSKYTHVGMIVRDPQFHPEKKGVFLLESGTENFKDSEDNEYKFGVQLSDMNTILDKLDNYDIYWRQLYCKRDENFFANLNSAHSIVHNRPYDTNCIDWIKAAFNIHVGNEQRNKTFWCSALIAFIYSKLGLLDKNIPWTIVSPSMFGTEKNLSLDFQNCKLSDEIKIQ